MFAGILIPRLWPLAAALVVGGGVAYLGYDYGHSRASVAAEARMEVLREQRDRIAADRAIAARELEDMRTQQAILIQELEYAAMQDPRADDRRIGDDSLLRLQRRWDIGR